MQYEEVKPHYFKMVVWRCLNCTVFPLLSNCWRQRLLRFFGAKLAGGLIYRSVRIYAPWNLETGMWTVLGPRVKIYNKGMVIVGGSVVISQDSYICTASHDISSVRMALITKPILVASNVWVGAKTLILPGVTIGEGAVIAAGAVVTKDVEPWTVVGGNPAKFIKKRELTND